MASTFKLKSKLFGTPDFKNMKPVNMDKAVKSGSMGAEVLSGAAKTNTAAYNKNVNNFIKSGQVNTAARNYAGGYSKGAASTGVLGGIKNTWKSGAAGKAGLLATGAVAAGLAGKALFGGKKDN